MHRSSRIIGMALVGTVLAVSTVNAVADYGLMFDGANDYVTFGTASGLGVSNFTVEVWLKRTGTGVTTSTGAGGVTNAIPLVTKGRGEADGDNRDMNYFLGIRASDNVLVADFEQMAGGTNNPVAGITPIAVGVWYHAAVTYNGSAWALYLNGALEATATVNQTPRYDSIQHAGLGTAMTSTGTPAGYFNGVLDEVRIWNYARTAQQISENRFLEIPSAPGLIGRWGLNEATGTTAADSSGGGINGALTNGPLWVDGFQLNANANWIVKGETWRYFKGSSPFPGGWTTNGFDDSGWLVGPSGFGYGDNDDATVLSDMYTNYVSVATRKQFIIPDPSLLQGLTLSADYDDGFVAYINGVEVARRSMPAGAVSNTTTGINHEAVAGGGGPKEYIPITNNLAALLAPGTPSTNVLAISVHNQALNSSDLTLIVELYSTAATMLRSPYLQMGSHTNMTIRWRTDQATTSRLAYGSTWTNLSNVITDLTAVTEHEIKVVGLTPDTRYYYSVGTTNVVLEGGDTNHFFWTAPVPGTPHRTRLWAVGDFGNGDAAQTNVFNAYRAFMGTNYTDAILMLGDNAYTAGTDAEFTDHLFTPYAALMRQTVAWPAVGNHDVAQATGAGIAYPYYLSFTLPTMGEAGGYPSGTERYYSYDIGDIHFICLDSQSSFATYGSAMMGWLTNDLNNTTQKWLIAYWHHPPYSKGSHNSDTEYQLIEMRTNALPVLESYGVDLVLCGHSHNYERSWFIDGHYGLSSTFTNTMLVDGGDGREYGDGAYQKNLDTPHSGAVYTVAGSGSELTASWTGGSTAITNPTPHKAMYLSLRERGSLAIDINGDRLDATFITDTGAIHDNFTIIKGATVSVASGIPLASETNPAASASMVISRTGAIKTALTINYNITGTASNGMDYTLVPVTLNLPKGTASSTIQITPIPDSIAEGDEYVAMTITSNLTYTVGASSFATVTIKDKPIDAWRFLNFGLNANNTNITCDTCDPDGDGVKNLLEYGLNMNPTNATVMGLPQMAITNGYLSLTFIRLSPPPPDLTYTGEVGSVLGTWTNNTVMTVTPNGDGTETVQIRDAQPASTYTNRFIRLKINSTP